MKAFAATSVNANDVDMEGASQVRMRLLIADNEGADNFHMRRFEVAPGGHTPHHTHGYEHEVYVLAGEGVAVGEDGEQAVQAGSVVFVPADEKHQFRNTGSDTLVFLCLIPAPHRCS